MPTNSASEPFYPDHCTACGSTRLEDVDEADRSDCCDASVCAGPRLINLGTPRRHRPHPCCASDPRYRPALTKVLGDAGIGHHGIRVADFPHDVQNALDLLLPQHITREDLRRIVASLRRGGWHCRPDRFDAHRARTVVRIGVGPEPSRPKRSALLAEADRVVQLAGFSPYRDGHDRAPFWGYIASQLFDDEAGSVYIGAHGPEGVGSAEAAEESEAMQQALREVGWTVQPALNHSFHAFAPLPPAA
ncbi:hypothetical protein ACIQF6_28855 [Kitasatospora sp. NPDC092948]|uniref:hypothetical protein n=1 Tax=Kitasatospora sp. NPDC092948 TaxID=3364088 RepID=UPI00381E2875